MDYIYGDETTRQGSVIVDEFPFMLDKEMVTITTRTPSYWL